MTNFEDELTRLDSSYAAGLASDVSQVKAAIAGASQSSVIAVGSGGSFTTASLLCTLHEQFTGRVSRPATCLELICNPSLASASPVFLISSEGKNPDIVEALKRARQHSARPLHVLTNYDSSPLMDCVCSFADISHHVFPLEKKDGYLATNSLLLNATIVARAYSELDRSVVPMPASVEEFEIGGSALPAWIKQIAAFAKTCSTKPGVIVTFSPMLRALAVDLESKLSEAALLYCQLADLRSFAHGRHLWMAQRPADCTIISFTEPSLAPLWEKTRALLPESVASLTVPLQGHTPTDLVVGLAATMHLVSSIANVLKQDAARPAVPPFGRAIYYMDLMDLVPSPTGQDGSEDLAKAEVLGARWPAPVRRSVLRRAASEFTTLLKKQQFRSVVFDYDGTLCTSARRHNPPSAEVTKELLRLVRHGVIVAIATGRGGSVIEHLRQVLPETVWPSIPIALYNGGQVITLADEPTSSAVTSEFLSHVTRIARKLKDLGVPIDEIRTTHPYQVSLRFHDGIATDAMWFVVADSLRLAGLDVARLECSKHSVDVLAPGVNKSGLIAQIVKQHRIDPYQVLTVGDQGAWPGNDASLLEHRFSLSVDVPSRRLDRGWKLAPAQKRHVDATLWYLSQLALDGPGYFRVMPARTA